jgi:hypothetical protein
MTVMPGTAHGKAAALDYATVAQLGRAWKHGVWLVDLLVIPWRAFYTCGQPEAVKAS